MLAELALAYMVQDNHTAVREVDEAWYRKFMSLYDSAPATAALDYSFLLPVVCTLKCASTVIRRNQTCAMRVALEACT